MNEHYPFVNPPLPYAYDALEPYIDTQTMYLHHDRLQQRYVVNLNIILKDYPQLQSLSLEELISDPESLPAEVRQGIINNAGGVYNHIIYFSGMTNSMTRSQADELYPAIQQDFGSVEQFFDEFKKYALSVFGSGYAWLVLDSNGRLRFVTTANQNSPVTDGFCVIAGIDVWEHAYFLKRFNDRAAYIEDWFHVVSWEAADERYKACMNVES
ncbi:superoxide dismutase [Lacrimispora saccharolytica]|uniref:Superoxide dismutase n=1 Tax=Lacrimispora saccharolytica (strain ATCC 35040 / DSM 2544 / NRCC 2533 / WM1) TaxID=610130 RepID=D9R732_LACSW|nr:superoxide dismutase [Lacrimispora saccharolytica]ADL05464.1 Superoxide dismutase [[Clostridium] saccharolyticum WM1]QRV20376.1 superoxide dismutase [Lacrimispora saccharolytica]